MNYISRLQIEKESAERYCAAYLSVIEELRVYLHSSKFHSDTTVQVKDVLNRIHDASAAAFAAQAEYENVAYSNAKKAEQLRKDQPKRNCEVENCGYFGRDVEVVSHHNGYSMLMCKKCYSAFLHKGEVD